MKKFFNSKTIFTLYILLILFIKILFSTGLKVWAFGENHYDDGMMIRDAIKLIDYKWLGHFDQYTLAKGITFPLFLAFINKIGLPYLLSVVLLEFAASLSFVLVIRKLIPNRFLLAVLYTILMFNPISTYYWTLNRVYRDSIYSYLVIFLFSAVIALFLNRYEPVKKLILPGIGAGLSLSAVWLAREDSPWIIPFVGLALAVIVVSVLLNKEIRQKSKRLLIVAFVPVILIVNILGVSAINYFAYGVFATNEFTGGSLPALIKELQSIQPDTWMAKVPVPKSTREKAYAVSPTFAKLKPVLENHAFVAAAKGNPTCDMFAWAVVDSVQFAGITDGRASQEFYKKSAEEIQAAVNKGELKTRGGYISVFESPWDSRYITPLFETLKDTIHMTVYLQSDKAAGNGQLYAKNMNSSGSEAQIRDIEKVTNNLTYYTSQEIPTRQKKVDLINKITDIYSKLNPFFTVVGLICYLYLFARLLLSIRSKKFIHFEAWLILTGLYLSYLLRLLLISYSNVSCNYMLYPMYFGPCYWLIVMATFTGILITVKDGMDWVRPYTDRLLTKTHLSAKV